MNANEHRSYISDLCSFAFIRGKGLICLIDMGLSDNVLNPL